MNRAARRRGEMGAVGAGVRIETTTRRLPADPAPGGAHQWVVTGLWRLSAEAARTQGLVRSGVIRRADAEPVHLDTENLMGLDGPGCWVCEALWSEAIADEPCPGSPT